MKRQIDYTKLLGELDRLKGILPDLKPDDKLNKIKELDPKVYEQLVRECRDFKDSVERLAEDCRAAVENPVYIGVVGHYSHGKSSLLNSLLFPPKSTDILPVGEGVVTSMCTLLQFSSTAAEHEFYEVDNGGEERYLPLEQYRARVSGKGSGVASLSHFKVRLCVEKLCDPLFKDFATKHIELLDTPGLGGPYWRDEQALMRWMKQFEMVVVCVNATEINDTTALNVNPFLKHCLKKIVPVVTFWDKWKKCPAFKGIADETKARAEAKKRLKEHFSSLGEYVEETIFVSAKACIDAVEVPKDEARYYTDSWNVDNVRRSLAAKVKPAGTVLQARSTESELDTQRREQVRQLAEQLCASANRYVTSVRGLAKALHPEGNHSEILQELDDDLQKEVDGQVDRIADAIERIFNSGLDAAGSQDSWSSERDKAHQAALTEYGERRRRAVDRLATTIERFKTTSLDAKVKQVGLRADSRNRLDKEFKRFLTDFRQQQDRGGGIPDPIVLPNTSAGTAVNLAQAVFAALKEILSKNFMVGIVLILALPLIGILWFFLRRVPYIEAAVSFLFALFVIGLLSTIWSHLQAARKKSLVDARNKTLQENTHPMLERRIAESLKESIDNVKRAIGGLLDQYLAPIDSEVEDILTDLLDALDKLEDSTHGIRQLL